MAFKRYDTTAIMAALKRTTTKSHKASAADFKEHLPSAIVEVAETGNLQMGNLLMAGAHTYCSTGQQNIDGATISFIKSVLGDTVEWRKLKDGEYRMKAASDKAQVKSLRKRLNKRKDYLDGLGERSYAEKKVSDWHEKQAAKKAAAKREPGSQADYDYTMAYLCRKCDKHEWEHKMVVKTMAALRGK